MWGRPPWAVQRPRFIGPLVGFHSYQFLGILTQRPGYFFRRLRTGFRKISHPSRYFSYFDRFFLLPG